MVSRTQSYTIAWPPGSYVHFLFISLVLQHLFLLPMLGRQIPNGRDFVITDRLLLYHLQNSYGHFTYIPIFAAR